MTAQFQEKRELTIDDISATFAIPDNSDNDWINWMYEHERDLISDVIAKLRPDDTFFDIGANVGFVSSFASQALATGEVVAFEPYPPNIPLLHKHLSMNASDIDASILNIALLNRLGTVTFTSPEPNSVGKQTGTINPDGAAIEVGGFTGDFLVANRELPDPDLIKIDVEGSEPLVLDGLAETLRGGNCRTIYCEVHLPRADGERPSVADYGETADGIVSQVTDLGFDVEKRTERGYEIHITFSR